MVLFMAYYPEAGSRRLEVLLGNDSSCMPQITLANISHDPTGATSTTSGVDISETYSRDIFLPRGEGGEGVIRHLRHTKVVLVATRPARSRPRTRPTLELMLCPLVDTTFHHNKGASILRGRELTAIAIPTGDPAKLNKSDSINLDPANACACQLFMLP